MATTLAAVARFAAVWDKEGSNGVLATEFFSALDADTIDLLARVGTLIQPTGPAGTGAITHELIRGLQTDLGAGLAMSTAGIQYGPDGSPQDTEPGGLNPRLADRPDGAGAEPDQRPWNDLPIQVSGYVPLMASLAQGQGFSAGVLRSWGNGRSWLVRDSGADFGAAQGLYRVADENEPVEGLAAFGNALPAVVGRVALPRTRPPRSTMSSVRWVIGRGISASTPATSRTPTGYGQCRDPTSGPC